MRPPSKLGRAFYARTPEDWERLGRRHSLNLFHTAANRVPAYKDFLKKNGVRANKIKTWQEFKKLPVVTKKNYLRQYPLEKLCWDGILKEAKILSATSGSTGMPYYFPRNGVLDSQSAIFHEMFFKSCGLDRSKQTLVVVCFGMGVWIGGLITYEAFRRLSENGYPFTILSPGVHKKEIFEGIWDLGKKFNQVILCGYPPFIKDIIDEGKHNGVNWHALNLRIVFAAEAFSEKFRDYILKKTGMKNTYCSTMNIYGSADLGTMAEETPISILIRRLALSNSKLFFSLFGNIDKIPTLAQYNPLFTNFESSDEEILCTAYNALPLIRYGIGDRGGVTSFSNVLKKFNASGLDLLTKTRKLNLNKTLSKLPFVYIYERSDMSTKLYGAIIYPEPVREALNHYTVEKYFTGKFTMLTKFNKNENEYLEINLELKPRIRETRALKETFRKLVVHYLLEKNAEYRNNYRTMPEKVTPKLVFWPYEHPKYFRVGIKQKWVKN